MRKRANIANTLDQDHILMTEKEEKETENLKAETPHLQEVPIEEKKELRKVKLIKIMEMRIRSLTLMNKTQRITKK